MRGDRVLVLVMVLLGMLTGPVHGGAPVRTAVVTGQQAPGTDPGVVFNGIQDSVINAQGRVAFDGRLMGPGVTLENGGGIWVERSGGLMLHLRWGDQAPGTNPGVAYWATGLPVQNSNGRISVYSNLLGPGVDTVTNSNNVCLFTDGSGVSSLLARRGTPAPGTSMGVTFSLFGSPLLNDAGHSAFYCALSGTGINSTNDECVFSDATGQLGLVARDGDAAPGTETNTVFRGIFLPTLNNLGQVAFHANLFGPLVTGFNGRGIWVGGVGSLNLAVRAGDAAPGIIPAANFITFLHPDINNAGNISFAATIASGGAIDATNDTGVWVMGGGASRLVALERDQAPGTPMGVRFGDFVSPGNVRPGLNGSGRIAFVAPLTGAGVDMTNDTGLWSDAGGVLELIAREGSQAPGLPPDTNFDVITFGGINNKGWVLFHATLGGSAVTPNVNEQSLWIHVPGEGLGLVSQSSESIEVAPGDIRTVQGLGISSGARGSEDGNRENLNDAGQVGFIANFTDGSSAILVMIGPDEDDDGFNDELDNCPQTANSDQADSDGDGLGDACDGCPTDANKTAPGICGCGVADADSDGDGTPDCNDGCPADAAKVAPGACGCGVADTDSDGDSVPDCLDMAPGTNDLADNNGNGIPDILEMPGGPQSTPGCCAPGVGPVVGMMVPLWLMGWKGRRVARRRLARGG
ncbi:MAG: thrombospondin type 3 repeat-containing protein [Planctomycetia bacterium]|nr:thrombospondin type 3 repeat-containing protein [Planctomycetia bacterium]MCC7316271.1 thrombospondin type 3 repeat-containing protein [Planctomycetota bacterium]